MTRAALLLAMVAAACAEPAAARPFEPGASPAYDAVWQVNSHNAYWVDRGAPGDALASGVSERLLDQLLADHARSLELDIHRDDGEAGAFRVYHTVPGNSLCATLPECLAILRAFHRAVPDHEVVLVVIELKELFRSNFDERHSIADLDAVFERELGPLLYRPRDVLARCAGVAGLETLGACVATVGWDGIAALRGRFAIAVLGNWDILRGQGTADWVRYASSGVGARVAFPMVSSWRMDYATLEPDTRDLITAAEHRRALDESVLLQIESRDDPAAPPFLARRGMVRVDGGDAAAAVAAGLQIYQSDRPSVQHDDRGVAEPFRAFSPSVPRAETTEPGRRLSLEPGAPVFAHAELDGATRWETTLSFGADATPTGCLRAAADGAGTSASLCARKRSGDPAADGSAAGTPDAERITVELRACRAGVCAASAAAEEVGVLAGPGELLALSISPRGSGSCVQAFSARAADRSLAPFWVQVGAEECFDQPLRRQGLARLAGGAVTFFGTTPAIDLALSTEE